MVLTMAEDGTEHVTEAGAEDADVVWETVQGRRFAVAADGFWQAHPAAATTYVDTVLELLPADLTGGTAWDLYGGVGLFAAFLADAVGVTGTVATVELDRTATALARHNLAGPAAGRGAVRDGREGDRHAARAGRRRSCWTRRGPAPAGRSATRSPAASPGSIVYVACDPAALARDTAFLAAAGYRLDTLRAFDAYPQTHHLEAIARFVPAAAAETPDAPDGLEG